MDDLFNGRSLISLIKRVNAGKTLRQRKSPTKADSPCPELKLRSYRFVHSRAKVSCESLVKSLELTRPESRLKRLVVKRHVPTVFLGKVPGTKTDTISRPVTRPWTAMRPMMGTTSSFCDS